MATPLVYALHSGNLYGTERMALVTAEGLANEYPPIIFAPPGPALQEATRMGFETHAFSSAKEFAITLRPIFARHREMIFMATGVVHSLACLAWNVLYRRKVHHFHLVHGGTDELLSYGRKRRLNGTGVKLVAVSEFVKSRLIAHGANPNQIVVIENFLPDDQIQKAPKRPAFSGPGIHRVVVVSRVDPIKRIDLLLDAVEQNEALRRLDFRILGTGSEFEQLKNRAAQSCPNVAFVGFTSAVAEELAASDLLLHLCPVEPFGLAILEAMAARLPVLVPDSGGASSIIEPGISGYRFQANSAADLGQQLQRVGTQTALELNSTVEQAWTRLLSHYSTQSGLDQYRRLIASR